jgi:hypothetical protein
MHLPIDERQAARVDSSVLGPAQGADTVRCGREMACSAAVLVLAVPVAFLAFKSASGEDDSNDTDDFEVRLAPAPVPAPLRSPCCHWQPPWLPLPATGGDGRYCEVRQRGIRRHVCGQVSSRLPAVYPSCDGLVCVGAAAVFLPNPTARLCTEMRCQLQTRKNKNMTVAGRAPRRTGGPMTLDDLDD